VSATSQTRTRIFKNKSFARFARRNSIADLDLCGAVCNADRGLIAADLGGGVIKQRLARRGSGKSGGFRALIVFRIRSLAVFVHGFAKNETENIRADELIALKKLAAELFSYSSKDYERAMASGTLIEVQCNGKSEAVS